MLNVSGDRRSFSGAMGAIRRSALASACALGAAATVLAAPAVDETYRWHGELVALDEAAGTVTLRAQVVSPAGSEAAGMQAGEPIVITWSGVESRAAGIRTVARDDGSDPTATAVADGADAGSEAEAIAAADTADADVAESEAEEMAGFLLRATFVAFDADSGYLTFEAALPGDDRTAVRSLTRGAWVTATSPHLPAATDAALLAVEPYGGAPDTRPAPKRGAAYGWQAELVALDEAAGSLTVKARAASSEGLAAVADAAAGDPIVITWSGGESYASGIRSAVPDDGSGLWGSNRFVLSATFVDVDATGRYLTFDTPMPQKSLSAVRALKRGDWASLRSPHHPGDGLPSVLSAAPYLASRERRTAPVKQPYRWDAELVSLDETGMLTVKSRVTSPSGLAAVAEAGTGAPIVITWSGYRDRASVIRSVALDDGSGLWGSNRFLLRATLVQADTAGGYLTFRTSLPEDGVPAVRALTRSSWATLKSMHHPADAEAAVLSVAAFVPSRERLPVLPAETFRWAGEIVARDEAADRVADAEADEPVSVPLSGGPGVIGDVIPDDGSGVLDSDGRVVLTVKSRVASADGIAPLADSRPGAPIVIRWSGYDRRASAIRTAMPDDGSGLWGSDRFVLRAILVDADAEGGYLTFEVEVPEDSVHAVRTLEPGEWARVTSRHQPADAAAGVVAVTAYAAVADAARAAQ